MMTNTESAMHLNLTYVVSMINGIINIYTISKVPSFGKLYPSK